MKKITEFAAVLAFVMATVLLLSCQVNVNTTDDKSTDSSRPAEVDWTNYQTTGTYAIRIKNESNRDLIAFKNSLAAANMIGGIPKNANDHGVKLNNALFNSNADFSIIFITTEDYLANKANLNALTQKPFTRIFAMYNASGTNEVPFIVSGKLGGNNKLVINNLSSWNMELRQDSPRGTTLGYAPYQALNTTLNMNDGSFYVFPVFKKYNALRDEIITIYPIAADGLPIGDGFSFINGNELTINATKYTGAAGAKFSSGAALLMIKNSSEQGITITNGTNVQKTETGISIINSGDERTFTILMDKLGDNGYEASKSISGWKVVNLGTREKAISAMSLDADYRYTITVTGDWSNGVDAITVSAPVKGSGPITSEFN